MSSEQIIITALTPIVPEKQCFLNEKEADNWKNQQSNKDQLKVYEYPASSDQLSNLKHIYCVF